MQFSGIMDAKTKNASLSAEGLLCPDDSGRSTRCSGVVNPAFAGSTASRASGFLACFPLAEVSEWGHLPTRQTVPLQT